MKSFWATFIDIWQFFLVTVTSIAMKICLTLKWSTGNKWYYDLYQLWLLFFEWAIPDLCEIWPKPCLVFIFVIFSVNWQIKYNTYATNGKTINGVLGIQTRDSRMEGADESTEIWRHQENNYFKIAYFLFNVVFSTFHNPVNWRKRRWCAWDSKPGPQYWRPRWIHWARHPQEPNYFVTIQLNLIRELWQK